MKNDFNDRWCIFYDIVLKLTLFNMAYGRMSVATDSDQSINTLLPEALLGKK